MIVFCHVSKEMLAPKANARDNIPSHFGCLSSLIRFRLVIQHDPAKLVFYINISFPENRSELITADENEVSTFDDLIRIVRNKLECLPRI